MRFAAPAAAPNCIRLILALPTRLHHILGRLAALELVQVSISDSFALSFFRRVMTGSSSSSRPGAPNTSGSPLACPTSQLVAVVLSPSSSMLGDLLCSACFSSSVPMWICLVRYIPSLRCTDHLLRLPTSNAPSDPHTISLPQSTYLGVSLRLRLKPPTFFVAFPCSIITERSFLTACYCNFAPHRSCWNFPAASRPQQCS
jgi:hypothetical protein